MSEPLSRRSVYYSVSFVLPVLMWVCTTVWTCAVNAPNEGPWVGCVILTVFCVIAGLSCLFNDPNA